MSALTKHADEIYRFISMKESFTIPWLQESIIPGRNARNSGAFRSLPDIKYIELVEKAAGSAAARYRLERGVSKEAFLRELATEVVLPENMIGIKRFEQKFTNIDFATGLGEIAKALEVWRLKFKPVAEFKEGEKIVFDSEQVRAMLSLLLTWLEKYDNDPRSNSDDARFALFILEEENS